MEPLRRELPAGHGQATSDLQNRSLCFCRGTFANIQNDIFAGGTEKWVVDYDNADGYVELMAEPNQQPVPEPATLLVLIPGLLGMGYGLRRRLSR